MLRLRFIARDAKLCLASVFVDSMNLFGFFNISVEWGCNVIYELRPLDVHMWYLFLHGKNAILEI